MRKLGRWFRRRLHTFDLLPDYFTAIAQRWQDVLWGASVPAVMFLLWWALGSPPNWALILIFVVTMFVAGYYVWRMDHLRLMPRLTITEALTQHTPTSGPAGPGSALYIQVVPKCLSDAQVEECIGHLLSVKRLHDSDWQPTEINEPLLLKWSNDDDCLPKTIYPNVPRRLNVFAIHSNQQFMMCTNVMPLRGTGTLNTTDTFRFHIKLTAKDCEPVDVALKVKIGSQWNKPELIKFVQLISPEPR
jgi:hypothetical protein